HDALASGVGAFPDRRPRARQPGRQRRQPGLHGARPGSAAGSTAQLQGPAGNRLPPGTARRAGAGGGGTGALVKPPHVTPPLGIGNRKWGIGEEDLPTPHPTTFFSPPPHATPTLGIGNREWGIVGNGEWGGRFPAV